jgi:lipoprotein-anchoring transpeptidase ErfK/SrfK
MIRGLTGLLVAAATMSAGASTASASPAPRQELAALLASQRVAASPGGGSGGDTLRDRRPITLGQTVVPVVGRHATAAGAKWLKIMVPGRPNGRTGWIRKRGTLRTTTRWHLVVSEARRRVLVYRGGRLKRSLTAIVGAPGTPTPRGRFFVEESVQMLPGSAGGPFALALSARSNVLQEFEGGPGQIALHGVDNLGGTFGTASSHGCVRLTGTAIRWLAARISPGVPVTIRR